MGWLLGAQLAYLLANYLYAASIPTYRTGDAIDGVWFFAWVLRWGAARHAWHDYAREGPEDHSVPAAQRSPTSCSRLSATQRWLRRRGPCHEARGTHRPAVGTMGRLRGGNQRISRDGRDVEVSHVYRKLEAILVIACKGARDDVELRIVQSGDVRARHHADPLERVLDTVGRLQ